MNTADNVHAFMKAEKAKKAKKLMSVEQACTAKEAPKGKPVRKTPKPKVLHQKYIHVAKKAKGVVLMKWLVYAVPRTDGTHNVYVPDPFSGTTQYFDEKKDAQQVADYRNNTHRMPLIYRVAPVTITVAF